VSNHEQLENNIMKQPTIQEIIDYASTLGLVFTVEVAQDVLDTKPEWYIGTETAQEAVDDYIEAYGA
jgi:hypothetical protein